MQIIEILSEFVLPSDPAQQSTIDILNDIIKTVDSTDPLYQQALEIITRAVNGIEAEQTAPPANISNKEIGEPMGAQPISEDFRENQIIQKFMSYQKNPQMRKFLENMLAKDRQTVLQIARDDSRRISKEYTRGKKTQQSSTDAANTKINTMADKIARNVGMDDVWSANLVGQLRSLTNEEKITFLTTCINGTGLDWDSMVQVEEDLVSRYIGPSIKSIWPKISKGIYSLPLSLSVGGGQSGNGEAMFAILLNGVKPDKGDIMIRDEKYEVKATQAKIGTLKGGEEGAATVNHAWLEGDSTKASDVKTALINWLKQNGYNNLAIPKIIDAADFRSQKRVGLDHILSQIGNKQKCIDMIVSIHASVFPRCSSKFKMLMRKWSAEVLAKGKQPKLADADDIARIQGGMAILEYAVGKHRVKNYLFLSSIKGKSDIGFVISKGAKATIARASTPGGAVQFKAGITFQGGGVKKASPGVTCYITQDGEIELGIPKS
jgi:hypothetical protein